MSEKITYIGREGFIVTLEGVTITQAKQGKFWVWSEEEQINLAYNENGREEALCAALDSALFLISLRTKELNRLRAFEKKFLDLAYDMSPKEDE